MTPKEKAKELVEKFSPYTENWDFHNNEPLNEENDIEAALLCVDEIIKSIRWSSDFNNEQKNKWNEVKKELEKLRAV